MKPDEYKNPIKKTTDHARLDAEKSMAQAAIFWEEFKTDLCKESRTWDDMATKLNELLARMDTLRSPPVRLKIQTMLEAKLAEVFQVGKLKQNLMLIEATCPNRKPRNKKKKCGFTGKSFVSRKSFEAGNARAQCPACKGLIHQMSMRLVGANPPGPADSACAAPSDPA